MKTTENFRNELYEKYGKRLIVPDDAIYLGNKKDIKVICPTHGIKWMRPNNLLNGAQCRDCAYKIVKVKNSFTTDEFLKKAREIHNCDYDYPFINDEYGKRDMIHILCKKCGHIFEQSPKLHLRGRGCDFCNPPRVKYTTETLREKIKSKHPTIELISEFNGDNDSEIIIKCTKHNNEWKTTPHRLSQQKYACKYCYRDDRILKTRAKEEKKFNEFLKIHYEKLYDTSKIRYVNSHTLVDLSCPIHGLFSLTPNKMKNRLDGCPYCKESHLEREIRIILGNLSIEYEKQKGFEWLINKSAMHLDFYLPNYNVAIECQGEQHIDNRKSLFTKNNSFEDTIYRDKLKLKLCNENKIPIVYIFGKHHYNKRLNEEFSHMYDNALLIDDIIENHDILLNKIKDLAS